MGLARDDCASLKFRAEGQSVVCAVLLSDDPPTIRDDTGTATLCSLPTNVLAEVGDTCLFLFDCSVQPPKCLRVTAIPHDLAPVMHYQLMKFRGSEVKSMGVSWVFEHEKTAKEVERLLEGGGAEQIGTFTVDCLPYIPNDKVSQ
ncbi:hypothetical protein ANCCAN_26503 [Ancylostoma caninum]|uniref:Uncharacterized protein n=1 Tax=Ancylostoma caninum TaxID=29170 RepID=A0A368F6R8_ANCCA|nr:hypothetical protein ANCCAN_26503 [Ancylostoma caninum]